jgi:hypothetical protein
MEKDVKMVKLVPLRKRLFRREYGTSRGWGPARRSPLLSLLLLGTAVSLAGFAAEPSHASESGLARTALVPLNGWTTSRRLATPHATQAAAADADHLYAISSTVVARFDRRTGRLLDTASSPTAQHLNSGFFHDGRMYLAHSNYPATPHASDIRVYTPGQNRLQLFHTFPEPPGSLVWCIRRQGNWWCCFAHYGSDNHQTCLVEYADGGFDHELRRFLFPLEVIADFDGMSASGGIWDGDTLLASHHHFPVLYRLRLPGPADPPDRLVLIETLHCPFPGQGFAIDLGRTSSGRRPYLVGIDRPSRAVVLAKPDHYCPP